MPNAISSYKSVPNTSSQIIEGNLFNGVTSMTFASGETVKYMLLEIPADITAQYIVQGLTLQPYDDTFRIDLYEGITTLTTGTPINAKNMNRNFGDTPLCTFSINPNGIYGGEGTFIEYFNPFTRITDTPVASKLLKDNVERIFKASQKYLFKFSRAADTNMLTFEFRWIWFAS
jgi:hypothetical protein